MVDTGPVMVRTEPQQIAALDDWWRPQTDTSGPERIRFQVELGPTTALDVATAVALAANLVQ
jgi:hypothetical protein